MTTRLPSLDFMNDTLKPNTIELNKPIILSNKETKRITQEFKQNNSALKKHLKEILLPNKKRKSDNNKTYYNKNKTKILEHKSNRFKTKIKITKELQDKFTIFLDKLVNNPYLPGTYNVKVNNKLYTFTCKITLTNKNKL